MKITAIETIRLPDRPNLLLAQVHTDEGLVGLGETSRGPATVEAQLHEIAAPYLLGKDPLQIQLHNRHLMGSARLLPDLASRPGVTVRRSAA